MHRPSGYCGCEKMAATGTQRFPSKGCFDLQLTGFEEDTMTKFIVWTKDKAFGVDDPKPGSKKIMWELQYVPFDGIPFMVVGRRVYSCHQGVDKHKHEKQTRQLQMLDDHSDHQYEERRCLLKDSKKLGCPARIYVVHLIRFPDYKIHDDILKQRKESSGSLRHALATNPSAVKFEEQYVAYFPGIEEHKNHPVLKELLRGEAAPPPTRRRFHALDKDIRNIIKSTKDGKRQSSIDQVNLQGLVDNWTSNHDCQIKYRPGQKDDDGNSTKLLFCLQTTWQQRLLHLYGQQMCLLDATYRTCQYPVPLFFLCVRTNVHYAVVGVFVTQTETIADIREALAVFRKWNPDWKPSHFMVDFSKVEIDALEAEFQDSKVLLCDFHREKAWVKWIRRKDNGCHEEVLPLLQSIAESPTEEEFEQRCLLLQQTKAWQENEKLRRWFSKKWLPQSKRWVHVFREESLRVAVYTSNGFEKQNEFLKHTYLMGYKNCSLTELLTVIVTDFLPRSYKTYIELNVKWSSEYRKYSESLPLFLKDRPYVVVDHIMDRHLQAMSYCQEDVTVHGDGVFSMKSQTAEYHKICFGSHTTMPSCTCEDWQRNLLPCKHFCAVFCMVQGWSWEKLGVTYRDNPLFSMDVVCLNSSTPPINSSTPPGETSKTKKRKKCGSLLREISVFTYHLQDEPFLDSLTVRLNDLLEDVRRHTPHTDTLSLSYTPPSPKKILITQTPQHDPQKNIRPLEGLAVVLKQ